MINLIPPQGKTALAHEYITRVASVAAVMLGVMLLMGTALLIPTYVLLRSQVSVTEYAHTSKQDRGEAFDEAKRTIKASQTVMAQLRTTEYHPALSGYVSEVLAYGNPQITFSSFQMTREKGDVREVLVQGVAATRHDLATLKNVLESSPLFEQASVPLSDLARDSELPFVITLIPKHTAP